ncbi:PREDICTED: monocyte differentiation antigen CD14 [Miniopterus natalensis]|uniref:monocyte differentiation antigen CD14 n=1 Tax=Miniopterus natalensis TaxID=291302 RepID=UPI0007A7281A|nr:PREDICTED: monocyte differentiation antigen CD14 [Miniopterus natalensis]
MVRVRAPCLLLLLPLLQVCATAPEPCEVDDEDFLCVCNFTDPEPEWSSALQCVSAVEVEIRGGGRSLKEFTQFANTDPKQYADLVKALRLRRLTVGAAQVPAVLLAALLRGLGSSRLNQLTLEDLEVTGTAPPPPLEATGPALSTLSLRNVSWATGSAWLAELQQWLRPGLKALNIAHAHPLPLSCAGLRAFPALTTLDLSDNPGLGERGLAAALCPDKFPAVRQLALLDLSRNPLRAAGPGAPGCAWPDALSSLNLSFTGLEQVPRGLPAELRVLDLSCNRLNREPRPGELPKVSSLSLDGNPFLDPDADKHQEGPKNSGVAAACAPWTLVLGMLATKALLQGTRA